MVFPLRALRLCVSRFRKLSGDKPMDSPGAKHAKACCRSEALEQKGNAAYMRVLGFRRLTNLFVDEFSAANSRGIGI